MRVSKVSLSLRSSTRSGERRRGASHCHNIVVAHGHHHGWWRSGGALVTLCVDVVMADGRHTHMVTTRVVAEPWSRCGPWTVTLSRRGRDRVTTRVVAESKAASDDTHGRIRTRFGAPHHVVIPPSIHCIPFAALLGQIISPKDGRRKSTLLQPCDGSVLDSPPISRQTQEVRKIPSRRTRAK